MSDFAELLARALTEAPGRSHDATSQVTKALATTVESIETPTTVVVERVVDVAITRAPLHRWTAVIGRDDLGQIAEVQFYPTSEVQL